MYGNPGHERKHDCLLYKSDILRNFFIILSQVGVLDIDVLFFNEEVIVCNQYLYALAGIVGRIY